jgi:uncharacterized protein YbjT (DUF2867 family)
LIVNETTARRLLTFKESVQYCTVATDNKEDIMSNKILVTGASGNIGQPLVAALKAAGADVEIMRSKAGEEVGVPTRVASFDDVASLTKAFTGIDTLFLLFPLVPKKIELANNAAAAAKAAGVRHIVRSSGSGADASSSFALPRLQGTIDDMLSATGIATTFLRPAGFMQNYATYQTQAIAAGTVYMADGGQAQSLIDVRDIADVAAAVLLAPSKHAGKAYTLTGATAFTGVHAAKVISQAIGRDVNHVTITAEQAVETMKQWQMHAYVIDVMDSLHRIVAAGYASDVTLDVERILGRKPRTFEAYVQDQQAIWKAVRK